MPSLFTVPVDVLGICGFGWAAALLLIAAFLTPRWEVTQTTQLKIIAAAGAYFILRAIWVVEVPLLLYGDYTRVFKGSAAKSVLELIFVVTAVNLTIGDAKKLRRFELLATFFVIVESVCVWAFHKGLMGWESFDTAFIALCLPFVWPSKKNVWIFVLALGTILAHHGTTALAILLVELLCLDFRLGLLFAPLALFLALLHHRGGPWLDGAERFHHWAEMTQMWWAQGWGIREIGFGTGSFMWLSMMKDGFKGSLFLQEHNEYLQIAFEQGLIGLGLVLAVVGVAVRNVWGDKRHLGLVLGSCVFGLTYHPLRYAPSAFVIAVIFASACYKIALLRPEADDASGL